MTTELKHYGMPRRSGRYPWGSGNDPYQSAGNFISYIDALRKEGLTDAEIAKGVGMTTRDFLEQKTAALSRVKQSRIAEAHKLKDKQWSNTAIAEKLGVSEATVRNMLAPTAKAKAEKISNIAEELKYHLKQNPYLDVGAGTELHMGVTQEQLKAAITMLQVEEGYVLHKPKINQAGTGEKTTTLVLTPQETTFKELVNNLDKLGTVASFSEDKGATFHKPEKPKRVSSDRIQIRYKEDGGAEEDGLIYLRRGVDDLDLGNKRYAQVRIAVDDAHYIKGMAVYKDDLPKGVDIVFNTNKSKSTPKLETLKPLKDDPNLPFGAVTKPKIIMKDGKPVRTALNIIYEEGDWKDWDSNVASQVLSKQPVPLAKKQLGLTADFHKDTLNEIKSLTNPTVKRHLLMKFADSADSEATALEVAGFPRQKTQVLIPVPSLKENQVYAPNFREGETVALIRYPHGGIFEIPQLVVTRRNKDAQAILGKNPVDAIAINSKVAEQLSGADFDGDTVIVIPNNDGKIKTSLPLKALKGFEPKEIYKRDYETLKKSQAQKEMGKISNLITDMTIRGADSETEIAKAVRHSMVVIDAEKHKLDYKQSEIDHDILALKAKYQYNPKKPKSTGASTLLSRSTADVRVPELKKRPAKEGGSIDKETGELQYVETGATYVNKAGKTVRKMTERSGMSLVKDAFELSSGTPIESVYATHANKLKAMANDARKTAVNTGNLVYSREAAKTYAAEVASLKVKLGDAKKNAPLERRAQSLTQHHVSAIRKANPEIERSKLKEIGNKFLPEARLRVGAKKPKVNILPKEWEAIQAGAVSDHFLTEILRNSDLKQIKEYATPKSSVSMTPSKIARAKAMLAMGYPQADIADTLGVSVSTILDAVG